MFFTQTDCSASGLQRREEDFVNVRLHPHSVRCIWNLDAAADEADPGSIGGGRRVRRKSRRSGARKRWRHYLLYQRRAWEQSVFLHADIMDTLSMIWTLGRC